MGAVLLTGATGFIGGEILARFLEVGARRIYALVRAPDDHGAAARLPSHERLSALAGDIEQPGLALSGHAVGRLAG
jgi:thioester reductase-like protein